MGLDIGLILTKKKEYLETVPYDDRYDYDGYDTEREWSGSIHHVMVLKIKTPTGRVRAETEFY